jgi:hypothetical protein
MPITVTPASMPGGTPGTAYSQALTASGGTGPYTWRQSAGALPPGLALTGSAGQNAGCTIDYSPGGSVANIQAGMTRWSNLVYPIAYMKAYAAFGQVGGVNSMYVAGSWPTPANLAAAPNPVQAAINLGVPFYMCYHPASAGSTLDASWSAAADKPAIGAAGTPNTILGDQASMIASVNALLGVGANIAGIIINQEGNGNKTNITGDQYRYMYYKNYAALKTAFPTIPVIACLIGYQTGNTAIAGYFPGPTVLNPGAALYCDGLGIDWYSEGYTHGCFMYSATPSTVPGYADLADYAHVPFGIFECGNEAGGGNPSQATVTAYLSSATVAGNPGDPVNSIQAVYAYRTANGLPNLPCMWYENDGGTGPNLIPDNNTSDFRIGPLRAISANIAKLTSPVVSGTPSTAGTYPFTVTVTDSLGATATASRPVTIGAGALAVTLVPALPAGTPGTPYAGFLQATGGTPYH